MYHKLSPPPLFLYLLRATLLFPHTPILSSPFSLLLSFSSVSCLFIFSLSSPSVLSDADISHPGCDRDQMAALDTLAAYYVQQARTEKSKELRKEYFAQVSSL